MFCRVGICSTDRSHDYPHIPELTELLVSQAAIKNTVRVGRDPPSSLSSPTSLSLLSPFFPSSVPGCLAPDTSCDDDSNSIAGCNATTRHRITGVDSVYPNPTSSPHIENAVTGSEELATDQSALRSTFDSAHLVEDSSEPQGRVICMFGINSEGPTSNITSSIA